MWRHGGAETFALCRLFLPAFLQLHIICIVHREDRKREAEQRLGGGSGGWRYVELTSNRGDDDINPFSFGSAPWVRRNLKKYIHNRT